MGGSRPMTVRRAVTLGALVAALIGIATGLSHIGHSTVSQCSGTWLVVLDHASDRASTSTQNSRAAGFAPTLCYGAVAGAEGGWDAVATFSTEADAQAYVQQLVNAGYVDKVGFQPIVEQAPQTPTP